MGNTDSESAFDSGVNGKQSEEIKLEIDPKASAALKEGLQGGVDAIQKLFSGFVNSIKDAMGPETLRNLSAGQWLTQVAAGLEEVAAAWRDGRPTPAGKSGEVACYLDRLADEVQGSRVESQQAALRERLSQALAAIESDQTDARVVSNAAGYFQAAAKSAIPLQVK